MHYSFRITRFGRGNLEHTGLVCVRFVTALCLALMVTSTCANAQASYSGTDVDAGPGQSHPLSATAESNFVSAASLLGPVNVIDFENQQVGYYTSLALGNGVTATLTNVETNAGNTDRTINTDNADPYPTARGYNTTPGGTKHLRFVPLPSSTGTLTFSFSTPIQGFGAYFTGLETAYGSSTLMFNDGTAHSYNLQTSYIGGGILFQGFLDPGASITQVTIQEVAAPNVQDAFGIDDVRFVTNSAGVPEISTLPIMVLGILLLGFIGRRRNRWQLITFHRGLDD